MTSNNEPAPYVASASSEAGGNLAYRCFDGSELAGFAWISGIEAQGWVKLDIGAGNSEILDHYEITFPSDQSVGMAPKDWLMQGSNNDADWDTLDTATNETDWSQGEKRTFHCDVKDTPYRYFKLNISANNTGDRQSITELYLSTPYPYKLAGTVKEKGNPVIRTLHAYTRSTGELFSSSDSAPDGTFSIGVPDDTTEMYVIALDDDAGEQYNALIYDRVKGVAI